MSLPPDLEALAEQLARLRPRALAHLDYAAALARHAAFMRQEPGVSEQAIAAEGVALAHYTALTLETLRAGRLAHVLMATARPAAPLSPTQLLVTVADVFDMATHPDFPESSLPWLVEQLADVGRTVLEIRLVDGPDGRVAVRV